MKHQPLNDPKATKPHSTAQAAAATDWAAMSPEARELLAKKMAVRQGVPVSQAALQLNLPKLAAKARGQEIAQFARATGAVK